jgi:hypothetical protein
MSLMYVPKNERDEAKALVVVLAMRAWMVLPRVVRR